VISELRRENQFLFKELWIEVFMIDLERDLLAAIKTGFTAQGLMENLLEFNIRKEIITDVRRENQFLSKEISESI
jgi:hypothetical protein